MARAAEAAHRDPGEILLLAVTKVFPAAVIREGYALGLRDFGENYVQEFEAKAPEVRGLPGARFHLIGHLQSNKSGKAAELFDVIQTVDSARLARRLSDSRKLLDVMLEVKLSPEQAKTIEGFRTQLLAIRSQLRDVQFALRRDVDNLKNLVTALNVGVVPVTVGFIALAFGMRRSRRPLPKKSQDRTA